jgi:hypothetical protein
MRPTSSISTKKNKVSCHKKRQAALNASKISRIRLQERKRLHVIKCSNLTNNKFTQNKKLNIN